MEKKKKKKYFFSGYEFERSLSNGSNSRIEEDKLGSEMNVED